jgi:hypothetical protein
MKTILIMFLLLANGGSVEVEADSIETCEALASSIQAGVAVDITNEFGETYRLTGAHCEAHEVLDGIEAGGEPV